MKNQLKPCPFCECLDIEVVSVFFSSKGNILNLKCPKCGAIFRVLTSVYNSRPAEDRLLELLNNQWVEDDRKEQEKNHDKLQP
jgi:transcription elongation factor Elf1